MSPRNLWAIWPVVCLLLTASAGELCAQAATEAEARAGVATEIRRVIERLHQVQRDQLRTQVDHEQQVGVLERQIKRLDGELKSVQETLQSQREERSSLELRISESRRATQRANRWIQFSAEAAGPSATRAAARVQNSAGAEKPRRQAGFDDAAKLLGESDDAKRTEGVKELLRVYNEEWLPARSVTLANEPIRLDEGARSIHGWVVRLGLATMVCVSEDGQVVGLWSRSSSSPWRTELPDESRGQVQEFMRIVREQRPPAVAPLPMLPAPTSADSTNVAP